VDSGLHDLVSWGFSVVATGSKFYGGPPFCGAALLPQGMVEELNAALADGSPGDLRGKVAASSLAAYISSSLIPPELAVLKELLPEASPNLGLLLRWQMALWNIENYHAIPECQRHAIETQWMLETVAAISEKKLPTVEVFEDSSTNTGAPSFQRSGTVACKTASGMLPDATIICLDLKKADPEGTMKRCSLGEMKRIHNLMARDLSGQKSVVEPDNALWALRCFLAQPVSLSKDFHVLRAAIGAPLVLRLQQGCRDEVQTEDCQWIDKLHLILSSWDSLPQ